MENDVTTVRIDLGDRSYDVFVGHGARHHVTAMIPTTARQRAEQ